VRVTQNTQKYTVGVLSLLLAQVI